MKELIHFGMKKATWKVVNQTSEGVVAFLQRRFRLCVLGRKEGGRQVETEPGVCNTRIFFSLFGFSFIVINAILFVMMYVFKC